MSRSNEIKKIVKAIDRVKAYRDRQERFKALVDEYGVTDVALASELSLSTVKVYVSSKRNIPPIGLDSLIQAEYVFKELNK